MSICAAAAVPHPPIIMPEIGHGEERAIQSTINAYREVSRRIAELKPETIVLLSPHSIAYADYFHISPGPRATGDLRQFRAREVKVSVNYDEEFVSALIDSMERKGVAGGTEGERDSALDHATILPLRFLNQLYEDYKLVRIGLSGLSPLTHYRLGQCIRETAARLDRRTVIIASGDLSHKLLKNGPYGFAPQGPEFDRMITEDFRKADFFHMMTYDAEFTDAAAECGLGSFRIMAGAFDKEAVSGELLSYEGPFGVGYGVAWFADSGPDPSRDFERKYLEWENARLAERKSAEDEYVRLARLSIETYVQTGHMAKLPSDLSAELTARRAGVFVSLKKNGRLRGCIGTIAPTADSVAEEILRNAISAATKDPRFDPVTEEELSSLVYDVDVLGDAEGIDSPDQLDVKRYGVIVENGFRRGLLLPDLEGVENVGDQISIARQKAGIRPDEKISLKRFEVTRHV